MFCWKLREKMKTVHGGVRIQHHKNKSSFVIYKHQPQLIEIIKLFQLFSLCCKFFWTYFVVQNFICARYRNHNYGWFLKNIHKSIHAVKIKLKHRFSAHRRPFSLQTKSHSTVVPRQKKKQERGPALCSTTWDCGIWNIKQEQGRRAESGFHLCAH